MRSILISIVKDSLIFFVLYSALFLLVEEVTENLPASWDRTGWGMLTLIVLFFGFVIGSFKVGAGYSDKPQEVRHGSIIGVFKRPIRSVKFGILSLVLCILLVYLLMVINDYLYH